MYRVWDNTSGRFVKSSNALSVWLRRHHAEMVARQAEGRVVLEYDLVPRFDTVEERF